MTKTNPADEPEYRTLADLVGKGWVSAGRDEVEPPLCRWRVGGVSLLLSPDGSGDGKPIGTSKQGATTVTSYLVGSEYEYKVETDVDYHDPSGPFRIRVTEHGVPDLGDRTSILAYENEVEILNRAKRELATELDEDLALHEALVILAERYLDEQ